MVNRWMVGGRALSAGLTYGYCAIDGLLSWGHHQSERGFLCKFFGILVERSECKDSISMKAPICDGDYTIDRTVSLTPQARGYLDYRVIIEDLNKVNRRRQKIFT